jgi:hypothetical protein
MQTPPPRWPAPFRLYLRLSRPVADALREAATRSLRSPRDQAAVYIAVGLRVDGYLSEAAAPVDEPSLGPAVGPEP